MTSLRLILAGAAIGNANRGVEALARSVADAVDAGVPGGRLTILDDDWGFRAEPSGRYRRAGIDLAGARVSRRWHRPESWARIRMGLALGGRTNLLARRILTADALLDISGGDSFTDMYGAHRFRAVLAPKLAAINAGCPLVLLPQTYGPFDTAEGLRDARHVVRHAGVAYARDPRSWEILSDLAGPDQDRARVRLGVDVAFGMRPVRPADHVADLVTALAHDSAPLAGVNVSGLLCTPGAGARFGLAGDYVATMTDLVRALVAQGAQVLLVPHVHLPGGAGESDVVAMTALLDALGPTERGRVTLLSPSLDAAELKWCAGRTDWFVGSRMHATIGALSSGTPTSGFAYSDKTIGVFETCGAGEWVADARTVCGPPAVEAMLHAFEQRDRIREALSQTVPAVNESSRRQLEDLLTEIGSWHSDAPGALA